MRRSNGSVQRNPSRVSQIQSRATRNFSRRRLVPRSLCERQASALSLLADFEPKGAAALKYGAYRKSDGFCERALFVIDKNGIITWSYCSPVAVNPGSDGILQALERLPKSENSISTLNLPLCTTDPIHPPPN